MKRFVLLSLALLIVSAAIPTATYAGEGKDGEQTETLKRNQVLAALLILIGQQNASSAPPPPPPPPKEKPSPPPAEVEVGPPGQG